MKIKCSKSVNLISFRSIIELEKLCNREDIAIFLRDRLDSRESIDMKVKENFLIPLGLIDKNHALTSKGKDCIETTNVWMKERGEYTFIEIDDDVFRFIVDVTPESNRNIRSEQCQRELKKQEIVSIKDTNKIYKIFKDAPISYERKNISSRIKINYEVDLAGNSKIYIEDINFNMNNKTVDIKLDTSSINHNSILKSLEQNGKFHWNEDLEALEITFDFAKQNNEDDYCFEEIIFNKDSFEANNFNFDEISLKNIKVMPNNQIEAEKWYFNKISNFLKNDYIKISDFNKKNDEEFNSEFLKYHNIQKLEISEVLEKLKYKNEYWNLRAPLDLSFEN